MSIIPGIPRTKSFSSPNPLLLGRRVRRWLERNQLLGTGYDFFQRVIVQRNKRRRVIYTVNVSYVDGSGVGKTFELFGSQHPAIAWMSLGAFMSVKREYMDSFSVHDIYDDAAYCRRGVSLKNTCLFVLFYPRTGEEKWFL